MPNHPEDIVYKLLHTAYTGTVNSSSETRSRAKRLAERLGAYHSDLNIDETIFSHEALVSQALGFTSKLSIEGGSAAESLAKQNIRARNRLVAQYEMAQLSTIGTNLPRTGAGLLVLTSGNVDEVFQICTAVFTNMC
jgi:NAD+ synthase (glutamine-hydrolysing)